MFIANADLQWYSKKFKKLNSRQVSQHPAAFRRAEILNPYKVIHCYEVNLLSHLYVDIVEC